ncbi:hypothetical protein [Vallitalea maricola]|uniref:Uncharacterized protein n=1 Tax=Vallitalea maricola TaxID=3074433 RepID=A0ACB5UQZ0_9FIRM|nr:hypothetical protein AN2V17_41360 [Vallitalea sp. AN17-2]
MRKIVLLLVSTLTLLGTMNVNASSDINSSESYSMDIESFQKGDLDKFESKDVNVKSIKAQEDSLEISFSIEDDDIIISALPKCINYRGDILYFESKIISDKFDVLCVSIEENLQDTFTVSKNNTSLNTDAFIKVILKDRTADKLLITEINDIKNLKINKFEVKEENNDLQYWYTKIVTPIVSELEDDERSTYSLMSNGMIIDYGSYLHIYSYYVMGNKINHYMKVYRALHYPAYISEDSIGTEFYTEIKIAEKKTISTDLPSYNNPTDSCLSIFTPSFKVAINGGGAYISAHWSNGKVHQAAQFDCSILWSYVPYVNDIAKILNSYSNNTTVEKETTYDIFDQLGSGYVKEAQSRITEHLLDTSHCYISKWDLLRTAYTGGEITIEAEYEYMVNVSFDPGDNYVVNKTTTKTIIEK